MKPGILVLIVMAMCLMSISGCGRLDSREQADKLERSVTYYGAALRWGRHQEAIGFHVTQDGKISEVTPEYLEKFSVTGFENISKAMVPGSEENVINKAIIISEISYYHNEQGTVRKLKLNQIWWYNAEIKRWLIETDFPEFK